MGNDKKPNLSEQHLKEFEYRVNYLISETPRYRSLVGSNEQFDEVPVMANEAGDQEDAPKPPPDQPPTEPSTGEPPVGDAPVPAFDQPPAGDVPADPAAGDVPAPEGEPEAPMGDVPADPAMGAAPMPPEENPQGEVDELQNEIIKHNIEAMKDIHDQLAGLGATLDTMNSKMEELNADVEEVREPTNAEKLMKQSEVSYPYYFNLNDFWQDNWFDQQRKAGNEKGIKQQPDGSYVADFDELPSKSKGDIQDSFNDMI